MVPWPTADVNLQQAWQNAQGGARPHPSYTLTSGAPQYDVYSAVPVAPARGFPDPTTAALTAAAYRVPNVGYEGADPLDASDYFSAPLSHSVAATLAASMPSNTVASSAVLNPTTAATTTLAPAPAAVAAAAAVIAAAGGVGVPAGQSVSMASWASPRYYSTAPGQLTELGIPGIAHDDDLANALGLHYPNAAQQQQYVMLQAAQARSMGPYAVDTADLHTYRMASAPDPQYRAVSRVQYAMPASGSHFPVYDAVTGEPQADPGLTAAKLASLPSTVEVAPHPQPLYAPAVGVVDSNGVSPYVSRALRRTQAPPSANAPPEKRRYTRQRPERSTFSSDEEYQAAFTRWRERRDKNNKAVRRSRLSQSKNS